DGPANLEFPQAAGRGGERARAGGRMRDRDAVRFHDRGAGGQVRIYGSEDRFSASDRFGVSFAASGREADARSAADGPPGGSRRSEGNRTGDRNRRAGAAHGARGRNRGGAD